MSTFSCICKPNTTVIDQFKIFQCFKCQAFAHMSCYEYSPVEVTRLFCIKCRLNQFDPFLTPVDYLVFPYLLPKTSKLHETFKLTVIDKRLPNTPSTEPLSLGIICSKLSKIYEWPSENMTLALNNEYLKYQLTSYCTVDLPLPLNQIFLEVDLKEGLKESAILAIAVLKKKDFRTVAKEIAQINQLSIEDARKKFDELKFANNELEVASQFPIKDPITMSLIYLPARGMNCMHLACFDLMSFLQFNTTGTKARWKCPLCRKPLPIDEIVIDSHLHKILKNLRKDYSDKEKELENIEYICFDENGEWKAKQSFSEEWDKKNKLEKKKQAALLNPPLLTEKLSLNKLDDKSRKMDIEPELPSKEIKRKSLSKEELCELYTSQTLLLLDNEDKIIEYFQINSCFRGVNKQDFIYFLNKTQLLAQKTAAKRLTIFEKFNENKEHESLESQTEELFKESDLRFSLQLSCIWAETIDQILELSYSISKRQDNFDIQLAMEILLIYSYLNSNKNLFRSPELKNLSVYASFGSLLGRFYKKMDCEIEVYGKTLFYFSRFLPDLHYPVAISRLRYAEFYEKLSDFVIAFLGDMAFTDFVNFFCDIHLPPQDEIVNLDDKRLIVNFVYYFNLILKKKRPLISDEDIATIINDWDKYDRMKAFFVKEKLQISRLNPARYF